MQLRKSGGRGYADRGWLQSYHSLSFAEYFDRNHMHFSALREVNDDIIATGQGFGMHPHRDWRPSPIYCGVSYSIKIISGTIELSGWVMRSWLQVMLSQSCCCLIYLCIAGSV